MPADGEGIYEARLASRRNRRNNIDRRRHQAEAYIYRRRWLAERCELTCPAAGMPEVIIDSGIRNEKSPMGAAAYQAISRASRGMAVGENEVAICRVVACGISPENENKAAVPAAAARCEGSQRILAQCRRHVRAALQDNARVGQYRKTLPIKRGITRLLACPPSSNRRRMAWRRTEIW